jgi:hypothetical protein
MARKKSERNVEGSSRTQETIDKKPTALKTCRYNGVRLEQGTRLKTKGGDLAKEGLQYNIKRAIDLDFNLERVIWWTPKTPIQDPTLAWPLDARKGGDAFGITGTHTHTHILNILFNGPNDQWSIKPF